MATTHTTTELCAPSTEAEALGIENELREHGIAPVLVPGASVALPGIVDRARWGTIRVSEDELDRARAILEAWYERDDDEVDDEELERQALEAGEGEDVEARRAELAAMGSAYRGADYPEKRVPTAKPVRSISVSAVIATLSIALNVGLGMWIADQLASEAPAATTDLDDAHGNLLAEWDWREDADYPWRGRGFDMNGERTSELLDRDADGRGERWVYYDRDERMSHRSSDADEDGWFERDESFDLDERVSTISLDRDDNGRFDEVRVQPGGERSAMTLRDEDEDGFFETMQCGREQREIRCP